MSAQPGIAPTRTARGGVTMAAPVRGGHTRP